MSLITTLYYFPNDLYRMKGKRITIKDLDEIGMRLGSKVTVQAEKKGSAGFFSKTFLSAYAIDIMVITVEAEDEGALRRSLGAIYDLYGPYETIRGKDGDFAKRYLNELAQE